MRYGILLCLCCFGGEEAAAQFTLTQGGPVPEPIATQYRLDFAIPDAPALLLLSTKKSSILRPVTVREFAAGVSDFLGTDKGITLPHEFGIEFSPGMLIGGSRLRIDTYNRNKALYRLRLSAAARRSTVSLTDLAMGLRVALIDKGDLRANPQYLRQATEITTAINTLFADQNRELGPRPGQEVTVDDLSPARRAKLDGLAEELKKQIVERAWNEDMLDVAVGVRAGSPDSTGRDLRLREYAAWATYAKGLGDWGQWLVGFRTATARDTTTTGFTGFHAMSSLGSRFYAGTNEYKAFLEAESSWKSGDNRFILSGGGEARLITGGWVQFSAGASWSGGKADLVGNLTFKLGVLGL